jgi:hypothetical protein
MTAQENILAQLERLIEHGAMPKSACSGSLLKFVRPLLDAKVLVEERSGGGRRLAVRDAAVFRNFCKHKFPNAPVSAVGSTRVSGVARFRDSKAFASNTPEIVVVRAWREDALLLNDQPTCAVAATAQHGIFSFLLNHGPDYSLRGSCALVENPAVFTNFERLGLPIGLVIYGQGRASNRLLKWLAGITSPEFTLLHLPDYDPVGLSEFERLRGRLGERIHLHLPADLHQRFARHANRSLLDKPNSRAILANLRRTSSGDIRQVLALIDHHNAALEQEALFV